jgi:hypothetical protein
MWLLQAHDLWAARAVVGEVGEKAGLMLPVAAHGCRFLRLVVPAPALPRKVDGLPRPKTDDVLPTTPVFESGIGGFPCVRVPSLLAVPAGPLLAFAECRSFTGDGCEPASGPVVVDERERVVCMRASTSGGKTWGPLVSNLSRGRAMYPTALFDQRTKSVVLHFSAWPAGRGYYAPQPHQIVSTDSGRTFGAPRPVLPHARGVALFVGSCRGAVITAGPNAGRLLMAGYNHSLNKKGPRTSQTYVWYSDDSAASWQLAGQTCAHHTCAAVPIPHMSEPQIVGDGSAVALFSRSNAEMGCKCQNSARSTSGGETWSQAANCTGLPSPGCQGSVLMTGSSSGLYSGPASTKARANMSVFATEDAGEHWRPLVEVGAPLASGMYSCLENLAGLAHSGSASERAEDAVGLLWETSEQYGGKVNCVGPGCAIVFSRIKHDDTVSEGSTRRVMWFTDGGGWPIGTDGLNLTDWTAAHRGAITGTYPCCTCWRVASNGTFVSTGRCAGAAVVKQQGLTVIPNSAFSTDYVMNETWIDPASLLSAVALMEREGWDGISIDNENWPPSMPKVMPEMFGRLLGNISEVFSKAGKQAVVDISSTWQGDVGGPDFLEGYAGRTPKAVRYMDMGTYFAVPFHTGTGWHAGYNQMMLQVLKKSLPLRMIAPAVGMPEMPGHQNASCGAFPQCANMNDPKCGCLDYGWTEAAFKVFVSDIEAAGISQIDVWRMDMTPPPGTVPAIPQWFTDGLTGFLARGSAGPHSADDTPHPKSRMNPKELVPRVSIKMDDHRNTHRRDRHGRSHGTFSAAMRPVPPGGAFHSGDWQVYTAWANLARSGPAAFVLRWLGAGSLDVAAVTVAPIGQRAKTDDAALAAAPAPHFVLPDTHWNDTDGKRIEAHSAGMLQSAADQRWYWFGESKKLDNSRTDPHKYETQGVNCYSAATIAGPWKNEGQVLTQSDIAVPGAHGPWIVQRPKVIYNNLTRKFVMYFHLDQPKHKAPQTQSGGYQFRRVGMATAANAAGPYTFVRGFEPDGIPSLDMNLFKDPLDGRAYLIRDCAHQYVGISRLTPDYLNTTGVINRIPDCEGMAMLRLANGTYYLITSHKTGWNPNPLIAWRSTTTSLETTNWTNLGNPTNSPNSFNSQPTYVVSYTPVSGKPYFVYMGDDWVHCPNADGSEGPLVNACYVWLPIQIYAEGAGSRGLPIEIDDRFRWDLEDPFNPAGLRWPPPSPAPPGPPQPTPQLPRRALLAGQLRLALGPQGCNKTAPCPCPCADPSLCLPLGAADQPRAGADHVVAFSSWEFAGEPKPATWTGPLHFDWDKITIFAPFDNIDRGYRRPGQPLDELMPEEAMYLVRLHGSACCLADPVRLAACSVAGHFLPGAQAQGDDPHQRLHQLGWRDVPCQRVLLLGAAVQVFASTRSVKT